MPLARHAEVRRGQDPAARVGDRRGQRPLVRVDPDHVARMIGRHQQMRRSRTAPLRSFHGLPRTSQALCCSQRIGRQHPGGRPSAGRTLLLGQADPRRHEPRPTLRQQDTLAGKSDRFRVRPRFSLRAYAGRRPRRQHKSTPGSLSLSDNRLAGERLSDASQARGARALRRKLEPVLAFMPPLRIPHSHRSAGVADGRRERGTEPAIAPSLPMADRKACQGRLRQGEARRS